MQIGEAIITYFWIILFIFAVVLTVIGILRWIGNSAKRQDRLRTISIGAFLLLIVMLVILNGEEICGFIEGIEGIRGIEKVNGSATMLMVNTSKILIKGLLMAIVSSFSIIIALIGILFAVYGMWAITQVIRACSKNGVKKDQLENNLKEKADKIVSLFKLSAFKITIVGGILALYVMLPIIMGETSNSNSLAEHWLSGVNNIVNGIIDETGNATDEASDTADKADSAADEASDTAVKADSAADEVSSTAVKAGNVTGEASGTADEADRATSETDNQTEKENSTNNILSKNIGDISSYTLIFVVVLGVGYVAFGILYEIIKERLNKKDVFLNKYSNSIGVLALGVSLLLLISNNKWGTFEKIRELLEKAQPFVIVIFVIAFGILTLEIVSLLMDMKERLIRRMARYLFILLVGMCTSLFVKVFLMVFNTVVGILGRKDVIFDEAEEYMEYICNRIMIKIMEDMEEELNRKDTKEKEMRIPFKAFKGRVVRKEEGES